MTFTQTHRQERTSPQIVRPDALDTRYGNLLVLGVRKEVTHAAARWYTTLGHHHWVVFVAYGHLTARETLARGTVVPLEIAQHLFPTFAKGALYSPIDRERIADGEGGGDGLGE